MVSTLFIRVEMNEGAILYKVSRSQWDDEVDANFFGRRLFRSMCIGGSKASSRAIECSFIAIDDLNDWIGCFGGNPQVQTPHLDRFNASGGMVMFDAHSSSTVCGPSRSSLLTGKYPHTTGGSWKQK